MVQMLINRLKKLSIKDKYTYSSILLLVLFFIVINLIYSLGFSSLLEKRISEYTASNLYQANIRIEEKLTSIQYLTDMFSGDVSIQRVLKKAAAQKTPAEQYDDFLAIESIYDSFVYYNKDSISVLIIGTNGEVYRLGNAYDIDISNYQESQWYINAERLQGAISWNGIRKSSYTSYGQEQYFLSLSRSIIDYNTGEPLGVVLVEINENSLFDILQQVNMTQDSDAFIVDSGGNIISHSDKSKMSQYYESQAPITDDFPEQTGHYIQNIHGENKLIVYFTSSLTGWKFIHSIPTKTLMSQMSFIQRFNFIVLAIACLMTSIISFFISRSIVKPLIHFKKVVESINNENLNVKIDISSEDEVGFLAAAFNKMIDRIGQLLKQVRTEEAEKRDAEIKFLQNQINPHFIYNTLESIRMICEINHYAKASKPLFLMGRLLRYGLSMKDSLVSIKDEIRHIQDYISLMEYCYTDKFTVKYHMEDAVLYTQIPKLTLQPIVENSIFHGLSCVDYEGLIQINAVEDDGHAVVEIIDNGEGIAVLPNIDEVSDADSKISQRNSGIGLYNINQRIKLYFGQEYGLRMESRPGEYTKVTVTLPMGQE